MARNTGRDSHFLFSLGFMLGAHEARLRALEETGRAPKRAVPAMLRVPGGAGVIIALALLERLVRALLAV